MARKVQIGAPLKQFPGGTFNELVDGHNNAKAAPPPQTPRPMPPLGSQPRVAVFVHNTTASTVEPGEILGFAEPIFTMADAPNQVYEAPTLKGVSPDATDHATQFVIALDFIRADKVGPAVIVGLAWVKVYWTDGAHTHASVETANTMLQSDSSGVELIWHEEIPDLEYLPAELWALVLLGGGGVGLSYVAVVEAFSGASWDGTTATDDEITVYPFAAGEISPDRSTTIKVGLEPEELVEITAGKFRRGIVIGGHLVQLQCTEWNLPEDWEEET